MADTRRKLTVSVQDGGTKGNRRQLIVSLEPASELEMLEVVARFQWGPSLTDTVGEVLREALLKHIAYTQLRGERFFRRPKKEETEGEIPSSEMTAR